MISKPTKGNTSEEKLTWALVFSLALHSIFFIVLFYNSDSTKKPDFVRAELWSSLPPELPAKTITKNKSVMLSNSNKPNSPLNKKPNNKSEDLISLEKKKLEKKLAKEKAQKEKLAKEKAQKEKLAKEKAQK
ncbi:MAG: hypothetical protein CBC01_03205, partial [Betaproteobacteria bacterium TMED41]